MENLEPNVDFLAGLEHESYLYDTQLSALTMLTGFPTFNIDFIGYLSLGSRPTLFPLYLKGFLSLIAYVVMPVVHLSVFEDSQSNEVPVFVLANREDILPPLNLPWVQAKTGIDTMMHGVYHHDGVAREHEEPTIIHHATFPMGFSSLNPDVDYPVGFPTCDIDLLSLSDAFGQGHSAQDSSVPLSWMGSTANVMSAGPSSVSGTIPADAQARPKKKAAAAQLSLHEIMKACPKWRRALAYLRLMLRVVICLGQTESPHLLITILTAVTKLPISHNDVLLMASPWLSQFLYDTRRVAAHSLDDPRAGFGLGSDVLWGIALREKILGLLQMFTRPYAHMLPIAANGFVVFTREQIAKEIMYHLAFRTTTTCRIRLVMADLDPAAFRHAPHPPIDTLALLGSTCYNALMIKLISIWEISDVMPPFPTVSQVHQELRETAFMLLHQQNDPDFVTLMSDFRRLCTIIQRQVAQMNCQLAISWPSFPNLLYRLYIRNVTFLEMTRARRPSWHGSGNRDVPTLLPDSLLVTASVLFGWVDSHDLMAFLDVSLKEVAMQEILQQEEHIILFAGGGRCLMQDRMLRAQMEVSLFSNAISNACEELETRSHPDAHTLGLKQPVTVNAVENAGARSAPSLVRLGCFQPSSHVTEKCKAWLLASSSFQDTTTKVESNTLEIEYSPISKDIFLSLPRFLKAWVDHITYRTYVNASLAESKPPYLNNRHGFKAKESKSLDQLRSDIHILDLKKHRAQTEVDMLSEALSRIAESEGTESDGSSGSAVTYGHNNDWSDDWFSSSYASSNVSLLM
ncbi:hypothetical protein C8R48DRAFT_677579 [Suillus tomentosus]|nr:hypothetical protein C8R48DRAFT_677579 [Suillus tomentosus]